MRLATRIFATATLVCGVLVTGSQSAWAQPGVGGGGVDVSSSPGGANVTVGGGYVSAPAGSGAGAGAAAGGAAGNAGGGGGGAGTGGAGPAAAPPSGTLNAILQGACLGTPGGCPAPPAAPGIEVPPTPPSMAEIMNTVSMAITAMQLEKPPMCWTPEPANSGGGQRTGLVGKESWAFMCPNDVRESTTGPVNRAATSGVVTVTANAINTGVLINHGDGDVQLCPGALLPFTPYTDAVDASPLSPASGTPSPTCGHRLAKSSIGQPQDVFKVSATSNWVVTWTATWPGGTMGGVAPTPLTSMYDRRVGELQVLVTPN